MRVRLWIHAGNFRAPVIEVELPALKIVPEVLIWRGRAFTKGDSAEPAEGAPRDYFEVFAFEVKL